MLFSEMTVLGILTAQFSYTMPPARIFGSAALYFLKIATFKTDRLRLVRDALYGHMGRKLEVIGLKASCARVLYSRRPREGYRRVQEGVQQQGCGRGICLGSDRCFAKTSGERKILEGGH